MDLYIRIKNYLSSWDFSVDEILDLLRTLRKESFMSLWSLHKNLNGCYELNFGFDKSFIIKSDDEREYLIKRLKEDFFNSK